MIADEYKDEPNSTIPRRGVNGDPRRRGKRTPLFGPHYEE